MQEGKLDELDSSISRIKAIIETSLPPDEGDRRREEEDVGRKLREAGTASAELGGRAEDWPIKETHLAAQRDYINNP